MNAHEPDVLIIMYQKTFDKYIGMVKAAKYVIVDSTLVKDIPSDLKNIYSVKASEIAENISSPKISNMVLLGKYVAITKHLTIDALEEAVKLSVSKKFIDDDLKALRSGFYS